MSKYEHRPDAILERLVQVGTVTAIDKAKHRARVKFKSTGITSGWLHVLDTHPHIPDFDDVPQETEIAVDHKHKLVIKQWMPHVNDTVVCLYLPIWNSDGFVIGGIT